MIRNKQSCRQLMAGIFVAVLLLSCRHSGDIPFPEEELGYLQPVTVPLRFSPEKKLTWDTLKIGDIQRVVKKLDIDALPAVPYDTNGYRSFAKPPGETRFEFAHLPETSLNLDSLPAIPLQFKTSVLTLPPAVKTSIPFPQTGYAMGVLDFGPPKGLQAKVVTALLKSKDGLMWVAALEGLSRYDGQYAQAFITGPNGPPIVGMTEDSKGRIWYVRESGIGMIDPTTGTLNFSQKIGSVKDNVAKMITDRNGHIWVLNQPAKAVSVIDPETMTFKNVNKKAGISDSLAFGLLEDGDKNIWITTLGDGVNIIEAASDKIKFLKKATGLGSDTSSAMTIDKMGRVWLAEPSTGVAAVDIKNGIITQYSQLERQKGKFIFDLSFDDKNNLWISTSHGVEIMDLEKGMIKSIGREDGLIGAVVTSTVRDNYDRMWVSTTQGVNIIEQNGRIIHPLGTTIIITMMEDTLGNLWIATDHGILIIDTRKNLIRTLNKSNGLGNDFVQSFTRSNEQIWVTTNGGLDIIDLVHKTIEHTGKKEGLLNDTTYVVFKDIAGNTWLTGPSNGVDVIDSAKKIIRHTGISGGLSDNNTQDIKQDKNGMIWLASFKSGINLFDPVSGTVKYLNNQPGLQDTCNRMILTDKKGRIWIGTDKGIYIADLRTETLTSITTRQGLASNRIKSLLEYNGSVIAGTQSKINIITAPENISSSGGTAVPGENWKITVLNHSEVLERQQLNAWNTDMITQKGQYFWGDRGLTIINDINPVNDTALTYVTGLNVMTQRQYFVTEPVIKDTLWATDTFFTRGNTTANYSSSTTKGFNWDSVSGPYNMPVNLQIPYNNNYIQLHFTQAHLSRQDTVFYCYLLEGIDKNWNAVTSNSSTENYLNLPPGQYHFKVRSKTLSGRWSKPAIFSFVISPPWYKTWWVYLLLALLGAGILRTYIVYRSRRLKNENKLLEEKVNLRTQELQQSIENLKATQAQLIQSEKMASLGELTAGIAHEIQNPLNFVNNFSEVNTELIEEMKDEIDKGNLEDAKTLANDIAANEQKINQHGKRADAIVKGMLQHSRSSNGVKESSDINALADEYLRLAYHGLRAKDKSFNATMKTNYDAGMGNIDIIPQDIGRVILNLITNAFYAVAEKKKQLGESYDPVVTVSTSMLQPTGDENGTAIISVKDNGNGIPPKALDKIFQAFFTTKPTGQGTGLGLSMSYDIITKAHGGALKVKTVGGEGAEFIIELPVQDQHPSPAPEFKGS